MKTINILLSLVSVFSMIGSIIFHYLIRRPIPWFYVALGSVIYLAVIVAISATVQDAYMSKKSLNRLLLGCHLSYLLIAGGTLLVTGFWGSLGILISSIALGFIPSLVATVLESID